jgi:hypothetical protein
MLEVVRVLTTILSSIRINRSIRIIAACHNLTRRGRHDSVRQADGDRNYIATTNSIR